MLKEIDFITFLKLFATLRDISWLPCWGITCISWPQLLPVAFFPILARQLCEMSLSIKNYIPLLHLLTWGHQRHLCKKQGIRRDGTIAKGMPLIPLPAFAAQSIFINHSFHSNFPGIVVFRPNAKRENVKLLQSRHHKIISQEQT